MRITWYGHAAFLIETQGVRVILDPYRSPDSGGYEPVNDSADVVVVSHENDKYHSHLGQIIPPFETLRALEFPHNGVTFRGIRFDAVRVFETPARLAEDEVTIVHFRAEGLHVVFLGDLGHPLSKAELAPLAGADIVLAAAGGPPTIDFGDIPELLDALGAPVVIPMHYKTPKINLKIQPVERFLEVLPRWRVEHRGECSLEVTKHTLPKDPTIVLLQHLR